MKKKIILFIKILTIHSNSDKSEKCLKQNTFQCRHGQFLAGKAPTVAVTSATCRLLFFKIQARNDLQGKIFSYCGSTKVHKVLQSEKKKACGLQWITKHQKFCPLGQEFSFYESTKTHQVFQSERKKANVLYFPKFGSTKVH